MLASRPRLARAGRVADWQRRLSAAVPFDEDDKSAGVWFLDTDYMDKMYRTIIVQQYGCMFKKVAVGGVVAQNGAVAARDPKHS